MSYRVPLWSGLGLLSAVEVERHNAEAQNANAELDRLERERDEARAEVERLSEKWKCALLEALQFSNELKEERKAHEATKAELTKLKDEHRQCEYDSFDSLPTDVRHAMHKLRDALGSVDWCPSYLIGLATNLATNRPPAAPAPLPASVEALMFRVQDDGGRTVFDRNAQASWIMQHPDCAVVIVKCINAAIRAAVELTRKEVAPVDDDDGMRYRLVYADGQADAGEDFSPGSLFTWRTALEVVRVFKDNPAEANVRAALVPRPVAPHVHNWSHAFIPLAGEPTQRRCVLTGCEARQVATWVDEPAGKKVPSGK